MKFQEHYSFSLEEKYAGKKLFLDLQDVSLALEIYFKTILNISQKFKSMSQITFFWGAFLSKKHYVK